MDAYRHFGLTRPPFDLLPDADFFHDAPTHAEALATLQYAVFARKGCCVVVGAPGYGKTLLARIAATAAATTGPVLWADGPGQSDNVTNVRVYSAGAFARAGADAAAEKSTLGAQMDGAQSLREPPVLIVDAADELPAGAWRDVLAWVSNEMVHSVPLTVLLFGLPRLLDVLATPDLARLQRRVFRTCRLEPLSSKLTRQYICTRVRIAGGEADRIFSETVMAQIWRLAQGNPALINQLADNALLEAFGEGREQVTVADVGHALQAISGERPLSGATAAVPPGPAAPAPGPPAAGADTATEAQLRDLEVRLARALRAVRDARDRRVDTADDALDVCSSAPGVRAEDELTTHPDADETRTATQQHPVGARSTV